MKLLHDGGKQVPRLCASGRCTSKRTAGTYLHVVELVPSLECASAYRIKCSFSCQRLCSCGQGGAPPRGGPMSECAEGKRAGLKLTHC